MRVAPARSAGRRRRGSTLIELMIVVVIMGVLAAMALPSLRPAVEQTRVDQAAAALRTIWAAQRFYRLDHGAYAADEAARTTLEVLADEGLIPRDVGVADFDLRAAPGGFPVWADRRPGPWSGSLRIAEDGIVEGSIVGDGRTIVPAPQFREGP